MMHLSAAVVLMLVCSLQFSFAEQPQPTGPESVPSSGGCTNTKRNILFITADDLRPNIAEYGHTFMHTPNIDKLAKGATLFQRAYSQYPFCAPSRNSFMTGRRPDKTKSYSFKLHFRMQDGANWTTMPQYFKENGYYTAGTGKTFQQGLPPNFDAPNSWDRYVFNADCNGKQSGFPVLTKEAKENNLIECPAYTYYCPGTKDSKGRCVVDEEELDAPLRDTIAVDASISFMKTAKEQCKPFFIHAGLYHPHLPWIYPRQFDNIYPEASEIALPKRRKVPRGFPVTAYNDKVFGSSFHKPTSANMTKELRRFYYGTVSFLDHNIGKLLSALEDLDLASNTAVVLTSDHGYSLGENNLWMKRDVMENSARVPLIIRAPWFPQSHGVKTPAFAELVDMYPTVVDLAELPQPESENLDGDSLVPLLENPVTKGSGLKEYAFTQHARGAWKESAGSASSICFSCKVEDIDVMGYSVRSSEWRYTAWVRWNKETGKPDFSTIMGGQELYNLADDFGGDFDKSSSWRNEVKDRSKADVVEKLHNVLASKFGSGPAPASE